MKTIIMINKKSLEFSEAYSLARREATKYVNDPMVLSWLNRKIGRYSPDVNFCQKEGKESWEIYGEFRGGILQIEKSQRVSVRD